MSAASLSDSLLDLNCSASTSTATDGSASGSVGGDDEPVSGSADVAAGGSGVTADGVAGAGEPAAATRSPSVASGSVAWHRNGGGSAENGMIVDGTESTAAGAGAQLAGPSEASGVGGGRRRGQQCAHEYLQEEEDAEDGQEVEMEPPRLRGFQYAGFGSRLMAVEDAHREFCEAFQFENLQTCWICAGYYAPNFGEPVCGVCHAFVFCAPTNEHVKLQVTMLSDDEDSGNDEPPYNATDSNRAGDDDDDDDDDDRDRDDDDDGGGGGGGVRGGARAQRRDQDEAVADEDDVGDEDDDVDDDVDEAQLREEPEMELEVRDDDDDVAAEDAEGAVGGVVRPQLAAARHNFARDPRPAAAAPLNLHQYIDLLSQPYQQAGAMNIIDALPVEVLLAIFKHLDDVSLWHVSKVCRRWRHILETNIPPSMWLRYIRERWPLFEPASAAASTTAASAAGQRNWFAVYSALMESAFCRTCLVQMGLKQPLQGRIMSFRFNRLRCDFRAMELDEIEGIAAKPLDKTLSNWQATIEGPRGSPYEDGKFFLYIVFPSQYPMQPPTVRFLTKIIHPNVSRHGDVGCDIIQHNWSLALTISKLLLSVQSLLTDPFTEICMEPQVGRLYAEDRPKFNALARSWTRRYAMVELLPFSSSM